jgi:glucosamine-6-phosphate deaminase
MNLKIFPSSDAAEEYVSHLIVSQIRSKPSSVMGWATGGTRLGVYRRLSELDLSFKSTRAFNLDEYIGLPANHPQSYHSYMRTHLFNHTDIEEARCHIPNGEGEDIARSIAKYEELLTTYGPVDFQLLGIGHNGHIGFNEPGVELGLRVHRTALSSTTIAANSRYFETQDEVPNEAITMGVRTILSAQKIVLLACGKSKAEAVAAMIDSPVGSQCPASALQKHPNVMIVLDASAAVDLKDK